MIEHRFRCKEKEKIVLSTKQRLEEGKLTADIQKGVAVVLSAPHPIFFCSDLAMVVAAVGKEAGIAPYVINGITVSSGVVEVFGNIEVCFTNGANLQYGNEKHVRVYIDGGAGEASVEDRLEGAKDQICAAMIDFLVMLELYAKREETYRFGPI